MAWLRTEQAGFAASTVHRLSLEVRCKRTLAVRAILEGLVPVRRESTWKHGDVTEHTLQRLVQDVGHLVLRSHGTHQWHSFTRGNLRGRAYLEVLRCRKRTREEEGTTFPSVDADLSTCATDI